MMLDFQRLSLINKVCQALNQFLGISNKDVAEFLVEISKECTDKSEFAVKVKEMDDSFPESLCRQIFTIIKKFETKVPVKLMPKEFNEKKKLVVTPKLTNFEQVVRHKPRKTEEEQLKDIVLPLGVKTDELYNNVNNRDALVEEDIDLELNQNEPAFLKGQTKYSKLITPIRVSRNPTGSLIRAAGAQKDIQKDRRTLKRERDKLESEKKPNFEEDNPSSWKVNRRHNNFQSSFGSSNIRKQRESLPIFTLKKELKEAMENNTILVVIGETGSGKTTQMTQYLAEMGFDKSGIIGCTAPRRVAAVSVAKRVAEEIGGKVGDYVGYTIRFEDRTSRSTRIKYMTDGMLKREYLADPMLNKYSVLILDEAHERTIHTDVLFALLKKLVIKRKDFKLIVTSATLDAEKFSNYFNNCPVFTIPGRTFPVEILYTKESEDDYVDATLITIMQIHLSEPAGDILAFLTGQEEIESAVEILNRRMKSLGKNVPVLTVLPAYGALPSEMQSLIFDKTPEGTRKCVIATNIAEASLTIDGIRYVVDPGFAKQNVYNAKLGMDLLQPVPISQASARQRSGRAGRTGPGKCYRLYTEKAYKEEMLETTTPEIQRTNLGNVVLQLKAMGVNDLLEFDFMDKPPIETLVAALERLYALGALDNEGLLTTLGRKMAQFPLEPVLAKTLLASIVLNCSEEVLTIVAMLSIDNPFYRPRKKQNQSDQKRQRFLQPEGDHVTLLRVYEAWRESGFNRNWCYENFIQFRSMQKAHDIRKQLFDIIKRYNFKVKSCRKKYKLVQKAFTAGFFIHAAKRQKGQTYKTLSASQEVFVHPSSALFHKPPQFVIYHELIMTTKEYMRNMLLIEPEWLLELAPNFFQKADPTQLSKRKRLEKIEPLHSKFQDKDAWRLSKRMA